MTQKPKSYNAHNQNCKREKPSASLALMSIQAGGWTAMVENGDAETATEWHELYEDEEEYEEEEDDDAGDEDDEGEDFDDEGEHDDIYIMESSL